VVLKNCHFKECIFTFSYFLDNLHIEDCTFDSYLDIQAGINRGSAVLINNTFKGFVNFFDRTFEGSLELVDNHFEEGTNILSEKQMITLPDNLVQKNNTGEMMCEHE
jgi:hypothetical protein